MSSLRGKELKACSFRPVPRRRSHSSSYHGDGSRSFSETPVELSESDVAVRKLAKLTVKHTPTPARALTPVGMSPSVSNSYVKRNTCLIIMALHLTFLTVIDGSFFLQ